MLHLIIEFSFQYSNDKIQVCLLSLITKAICRISYASYHVI